MRMSDRDPRARRQRRGSFRYDGHGFEIQYIERVPDVGETFQGRGSDWIVSAVEFENEHAVVTLRANRG
jgi:hypothetical protein